MYDYRRMNAAERAEIVRERRKRGYPNHDPPHPFKFQDYYLITAANFNHRHLMADAKRRRAFAFDVLDAFTELGCVVTAWIFLTNHYHLLAWILDFEAMAIEIGRLHGRSSRIWNLEEQRVGRKCWHRYSDRLIRNERHYWATVNYIHCNCLKHNCATNVYDWAESSVHWYLANKGRQWLRDNYVNYPIRKYGKRWDEY